MPIYEAMASLKREIVLPSRLMKSIVSSLKLVQTSDPGEKIGRKQKLAGSCWDDRCRKCIYCMTS